MNKQITTITLILLAAFVMSGCSTSYKPVPVGDELIWRSADERPGWTVDTPETDQGDAYVFIGQSLYHGTERAARTNAQADASSQAATYLLHELKRDYTQTSAGGATEDQVMNLAVDINETVELTADQVLAKMDVEDWYIEMWRKGTENFFKIFVKTKLPKTRT